MIRLVTADDQAVVRAGLSVILGAEEDIEVVGEADEGALLGAVRSVAAGEGPWISVSPAASFMSFPGVEPMADQPPPVERPPPPAVRGEYQGGAADAGPRVDNDAGPEQATDFSSVGVALTAREPRCSRCWPEGQSNGETVAHLYVEPTTIRYHPTGLMRKTGSRDLLPDGALGDSRRPGATLKTYEGREELQAVPAVSLQGRKAALTHKEVWCDAGHAKIV